MAEEQKSQRPHGEKEQEDREGVDEVEDEDEEEEEEEEIEDDGDDDDDDDGDEEEKRPSKAARLASDESGIVTTAVASPLGLGLGLGLAVGGGEESGGKSAFTFMQMQEFHHQSLIFKHMMAGIPVPIHLILPIWKSVAASYGPHHYPSFVGLGNLCYDFRNSMEPEPGRCRRTDGKKWRCSRDVVPDQKYCERHMHRGRNRSRKPVEAPTTSSAASSSAAHQRSVISIEDSEPPPHLDNNPAAAANARMGLSPTSVLSGAAACKTGAS